MEQQEKKVVYKIGGRNLDDCAKRVVKHALDEHEAAVQNKGNKIRKTPLCYYNNVKEALICAYAGVTPDRAAILAGYKTSKSFKKLINAIHEGENRKSRRLFSYYWHKARASLDAVVHKNILDSLLEGNVGLSRDLQKALNEELNEKKKYETTVNQKVEISYEEKNPRQIDQEFIERLKQLEGKMKILPEPQEAVEMKYDNGSFEPVESDSKRES